MNDLKRELAPISDEAWEEIESEARQTLELYLAARKIVDFHGPLGWNHSAIDLGRAHELESSLGEGVGMRQRSVQPLIELKVPFELAIDELDMASRGAKDIDLDVVVEAAKSLAIAEDRLFFDGLPEAGLGGAAEGCEVSLKITPSYLEYPAVVVEAISVLKHAGIEGPYAIALGPQCFAGLTKTVTPAGTPIVDTVQQLLGGPTVWAPAINGAVVMSMRGGDFEMTVGRDISIGYAAHTDEIVKLYLQESLGFRTLTPEAAVRLEY